MFSAHSRPSFPTSKNKTMTTEQLEQIIKEAPDQVTEVLSELSPHIREAAIVSLAASQDSEKAKAAVSVGLTLSINLATSPVSWKLEGAVSVRHKVAGEDQVADPTPELAPGFGKGRKIKIKIEDRKVEE